MKIRPRKALKLTSGNLNFIGIYILLSRGTKSFLWFQTLSGFYNFPLTHCAPSRYIPILSPSTDIPLKSVLPPDPNALISFKPLLKGQLLSQTFFVHPIFIRLILLPDISYLLPPAPQLSPSLIVFAKT